MPNFWNDSKNINEYTPIELYIFDFSTVKPRFFAQSNTEVLISNHRQSDGSDIVMNGTTFEHCATKISGVASEIGQPPTKPTIVLDRTAFDSLSNVSTLNTSWTDLGNMAPFPMKGATVTRFITLHEYNTDSDWAYESGGAVTDTDVFVSGVKSRYFVSDVKNADDRTLELELTPGLGLEAKTDSNRKMPTGLCSLRYRNYVDSAFVYTAVADGGCPYGQHTNGEANVAFTNYFDIENNTTADASKDYCNKSIRACRLRWDPDDNGAALPFMGQFKAGTPGTQRND